MNERKILDFFRDPTNVAISTAVLVAYTSRTYFSRYLKKATLPVLSCFVLYHCSTQNVLCLTGAPSMSLTMEDSVLSTILKVLFTNPFMISDKNKSLNRFLGDLIGIALLSGAISSVNGLFSFNAISFTKYVKDEVYSLVKSLPFISTLVSSKMKEEMTKLQQSMKHELKSKVAGMGEVFRALPILGMSEEDIIKFMKTESDKENAEWSKGKVSGSIYHGIQSHQDLLNKAFGMYSLSNPLHPEIWPSAMKYDSEIISMTASLVNGGLDTVCGCTSSGGTESIILAIKAHRDYFRDVHGITSPELISCTSAHAAVDKIGRAHV